MSYVVVIRVQVEGDRDEYETLIDKFRLDCLQQDEGMEQFIVCSVPDDEHAFLVVQTFTSEEAHHRHMNSEGVQNFLETLQNRDFKMGVILMAGQEIEPTNGPLLN